MVLRRQLELLRPASIRKLENVIKESHFREHLVLLLFRLNDSRRGLCSQQGAVVNSVSTETELDLPVCVHGLKLFQLCVCIFFNP